MKIEFEDGLHPWKYSKVNGEVIREKNLDVYISISKRIKDYYDTTNHSVVFAYGNEHLVKNVLSSDVDTQVLIYLDLPADNLKIVNLWSDLLRDIIDRNKSNVAIVPVPCIEYCVCRAMGVDFCDMGLYRQGKFYDNNVCKKGVSYEKYCKSVFNTLSESFPKEVKVSDWVVDLNLSRTIVHALPVFVVVANTKGRIMKFDEARVYASDKLYAYIKQLELYIDNGYVDKEDGEQTLLEFKERVEQYNKYVKNL